LRVSLLKILADPYDQLPAITYWLLGSMTAITRTEVISILPAVVVGVVPMVLLRWRMNVMTLGEDEARSLGVDTRIVHLALVAGATLVTAATVSVTGVVGWVGLIIPHIARMLVGPDFRRLLPASIICGSAFLLVVDMLARSIASIEIPLGILTAAVVADRVALLHGGKLIGIGAPDAVLTADAIKTLYGVEVEIELSAKTGSAIFIPRFETDTRKEP
jgi:iron complex transport system permease protein